MCHLLMEKTRIFNIDILKVTENELLEQMKEGVLVTPNLDHLVKLQKDRDFWEAYQKAEWVVCDSKILYLSLKLIGRSVPEPIPGSSFFSCFYMHHKDDPDCRIFLLGSMEGVADEAKARINARVGRDIVVGAYSPSYGFERKEEENKKIYELINESGANVVVVGVGAPKQERWIMRHKEQMPSVKLWMGLGATIDFEAGKAKRAPLFFQKLALEWFYRMCQEPKRMVKRYLYDDLAFFWYLLKDVLGFYKSPFA